MHHEKKTGLGDINYTHTHTRYLYDREAMNHSALREARSCQMNMDGTSAQGNFNSHVNKILLAIPRTEKALGIAVINFTPAREPSRTPRVGIGIALDPFQLEEFRRNTR